MNAMPVCTVSKLRAILARGSAGWRPAESIDRHWTLGAALAWNGCDNGLSRLTANVLAAFTGNTLLAET